MKITCNSFAPGLCLGSFILSALVASPAFAGSLGPDTTVGGTDFRAFAIGQMRDAGSGTLAVTGVTGTVTRALMYWHGPSVSPDLS